jgi:hypothetical protein
VVTDETAGGPAASITRFRLRWLAGIIAIMALLTAGWPLADSAVADRQPLHAGTKITIGSGATGLATVTVGAGWYVEPAQSDPTQEYALRRGAVVLDIRHVALVDQHQGARLWGGMRRILAVLYPGARLGAPVAVTAAHQLPAITGLIVGKPLIGTATVIVGPSREFAIGLVVLAPRGTSPVLREAAHRVVNSLMFHSPSQ